MNKLTCPHCGKTGLSLIQKIKLTPRSPIACACCGKGFVISERVWIPYICGLLLISVSGYIASYGAKLAIWMAAASIFVLLQFYWVPLEARELDAERPKLQKGKALWLIISLAASLAYWHINFFPSHETTILASLLALIVTFPFVRLMWHQDSKADEKLIWYGTVYAFFVAVNYMAFAVTLPAYPVLVLGNEQRFDAQVSSKSNSNKILRCAHSLKLSGLGSVCVTSAVWQQTRVGDSVSVVANRSWFGDFVKEVSLLRDAKPN